MSKTKLSQEDFSEAFASVDKVLSKLYPPTFDARDETAKLQNKVRELEKRVADLTQRVESLEQDRDSEEALQMERRERGYE